MSDDLQLNLINALNKLQHLAFDKKFLGNVESVAPEAIREQHFSFFIGQYHFVVNANYFCAVFVDTPIASVPNAPSSLVGLSNIRGILTPIYQLHKSLGYVVPKKQFIFCIGKSDKAIGLLVDALPVSLALSAQEQVPGSVRQEGVVLKQLVSNFYFSGDTLWHLLNGEKIGAQLLAIANAEQKQRFLGVA